MQRSLLLAATVALASPLCAQAQTPAPATTAADPAQAVLDSARAAAKAVDQARKAHVDAGKPAREFKPDCSKELAVLNARLETEKAPAVREALLVSRLTLTMIARETPPPAQVVATLKEVPPTASAWSLDANTLLSIDTDTVEGAAAYLEAVRARHPDPALRRQLLFEHFWETLEAKDDKAWKPDYAILQKEFAGTKEAVKAKAILESEQKTAVGVHAPAFSIAALGDPKVVYTLDGFKGGYLLLDFWATWCGPCRAEMPNLHKAWNAFKGKKFQILSLSFDRKVEHIAPFRAQAATPMPWNHAFVPGGFTDPLSQAYGVQGIPKPLLIGPDGTIVATGNDLRGEDLEKTLAKFLN